MKAFLSLLLVNAFFLGCTNTSQEHSLFQTDFGCHTEGRNQSLPDEGPVKAYWEALESLCEHQTRASFALKLAKEKHYLSPKLQEVLAINKDTVKCLDKSPLAHKNAGPFYTEIHRSNRVKPDSEILAKITKAFNHSIACFVDHNKKIQPYL